MTKRLLLAPIALAACSQPAPGPAPTPTATESGYIARVRALEPRTLDGVLYRAIVAGGGRGCQNVSLVEPRPDSKTGQPVWRVTCANDTQWLVALSDDGTALVTGIRGS